MPRGSNLPDGTRCFKKSALLLSVPLPLPPPLFVLLRLLLHLRLACLFAQTVWPPHFFSALAAMEDFLGFGAVRGRAVRGSHRIGNPSGLLWRPPFYGELSGVAL